MKLRTTPALESGEAIFVKCDNCGVHLYVPKAKDGIGLNSCPRCDLDAWSNAQLPNGPFTL